MSRQSAWQAKMKAAGKCPACSKPRGAGVYCDDCAQKRAAAARARGNFRPWRPGSPGRRPLNYVPPEPKF
mgnify:CR=1 FL=1